MPILTLTATGSNVAPAPFYLSTSSFISFMPDLTLPILDTCTAWCVFFTLEGCAPLQPFPDPGYDRA